MEEISFGSGILGGNYAGFSPFKLDAKIKRRSLTKMAVVEGHNETQTARD